jgi:NAD(P)H-hydrate epimerase
MPKGGSLPRLPKRKPDTNKGDYGKVLVVAGSTGMVGAAVLCSEGAYRSGAGLVYIAVPASLVPIVSARQTCAVVRALPDTGGGLLAVAARERIAELAEGCDVVAMGPGLGLDPQTVEVVRETVTSVNKPLVLDADALNAFAEHPDLLARGAAPRVLTPHPGELARLIGRSIAEIQKERETIAKESAARFLGVLVLKGHRTIVTDGGRVYVNTTGNPGMATGGSGDVLAGMIAALVGQGLSPFDAARLAVYLHGMAGDIAAREVGPISLMATDLLTALPAAFRKHHGS